MTDVSLTPNSLLRIHLTPLDRCPALMNRKSAMNRRLQGDRNTVCHLPSGAAPVRLYQTLQFPFDNFAAGASSRKKV
jgi:hypothetical protein